MTALDLTPLAEAASDRLVADDLIGGPRTIKITGVTGTVMEGKKKALFSFEGDDGKPFIPCKSMVRVMMAVWGKYANEFVGRRLTVFRDPEVTFGGLATGGVRISHMSGMDEPMTVVVQTKKGKKGAIKILPLKDEPPAPDPAQKWADAYIARVEQIDSIEALVAFENERATKLAELGSKRPELHQRCVEVAQARSIALAREDRPDDAFGDQHDSADPTEF